MDISTRLISTNLIDMNKEIDLKSEGALIDSIKDLGFLNYIDVVQIGDRYEVVNGRIRVAIARQLGIKEIPAIILTENQAKEYKQLCSSIKSQPRGI